jgi:hypothetical protein
MNMVSLSHVASRCNLPYQIKEQPLLFMLSDFENGISESENASLRLRTVSAEKRPQSFRGSSGQTYFSRGHYILRSHRTSATESQRWRCAASREGDALLAQTGEGLMFALSLLRRGPHKIMNHRFIHTKATYDISPSLGRMLSTYRWFAQEHY